MTPRAHLLAKRKSVKFADTLGFNHVGLVRVSLVSLSQAGGARARQDDQDADSCRQLRVAVPDGGGQGRSRHRAPLCRPGDTAQHMDIRVVPLSDEWATRNLQIVVRRLEALPLFGKWLVDALLADSKGSAKRPVATVQAAGPHPIPGRVLRTLSRWRRPSLEMPNGPPTTIVV